jgi:hypothetical protein
LSQVTCVRIRSARRRGTTNAPAAPLPRV